MVMARLFWLSEAAWAVIEPHLPRGLPGKPRVDDRRVISGILHVLKVGCRWRDVPPEYGPATTITTALTGGHDVGSGSACSSRLQPLARCRASWLSTAPT